MTKPLVYVAGPITGNPWGCVRQATEIVAILDDLNCHAYLPQLSVLHEMIAPRPYESWVEHGLAMVERCDAVWRIPGKSPGADREVDHAVQLGIPVLTDARDAREWRRHAEVTRTERNEQ